MDARRDPQGITAAVTFVGLALLMSDTEKQNGNRNILSWPTFESEVPPLPLLSCLPLPPAPAVDFEESVDIYLAI